MSRTAQLLLIDLQPEAPLRALALAAGLRFDQASRVEEARVLLARSPQRYSALLVSPGCVGDWASLSALLEEVVQDSPARPVLLVPAGLAPRRAIPGVTRLESLPAPEELLALLRELTAYREPAAAPGGPLQLDAQRREVRLSGQLVPLTAKEYLLIELLAEHRGRLFRRDEILERIWGLDFVGDDRIVDSYIKRLRKKLGEAAVETVRGLGYRCPELLRADAPPLQPHFQQLPLEARLMTLLAERVLRVTSPAEIVAGVQALLAEAYAVASVSLLAWTPDGVGERLAHAGCPLALSALDNLAGPALAQGPHYQPAAAGPPLALVPLVAAEQAPWAVLAFQASAPLAGWDEATCSALEVVGALVSPALRLNWEIERRERAEAELRALNLDLEARVEARTRELAHAGRQSAALHDLSQQLEHSRSVAEVAGAGLGTLARMGGARAGVLWQRRAGRLQRLSAHAADGARWPRLTAGAPTGLCLPAGGDHTVELVAASPQGADLGLLAAAARSFGLALERNLYAAHLERSALTDEFSGLPNRRAFLADLTAEVAYSARHGSTLMLALLEITNIRELNSLRGHAGGSALIQALAGGLQGSLRLEDRAYRLSGATFAVVLPQRTPDRSAVQGAAGRLTHFAQAFMGRTSADGPGRVRVNTVHLSCPQDADSVGDLLRLGLYLLSCASPLPSATPTVGRAQRYAADG